MLRQSIRLENENLAKNPRIDKRYKAFAKLISGWSKPIACTNFHIFLGGYDDKCCSFTWYHHRWLYNSLEYWMLFGTPNMWNTADRPTTGIIIICLLFSVHHPKILQIRLQWGKDILQGEPPLSQSKEKAFKVVVQYSPCLQIYFRFTNNE